MKKHITILLLLFFTQLFAQAPQKMSYQAVLRNTSNALIANTTVGMRISILQGSTTGTPVFVETQSPTTNANGLVSLEIGGGTIVTGTFAGVNWANGPFFIKTETAPSGGTNYTIIGTTQLLSVPYALYALNSKQQGKTTIILANDITDAQAAAQINQELGPNTENILISNTTQLTTVDFSAATSLISISVTNNSALNTVNFSNLSKLYGDLSFDSNPNLTSFSLNNLTESKNISITNNSNLTSFIFTNYYKTYEIIKITDNNNLQSISFPSLYSCSVILFNYNPNITGVSLPSLSSSDVIQINSNTTLNSINISSLTHSNIEAKNNKLPSSMVNYILHKFLTVNPLSGKTINLSGQAPLAPPTGQGIIDKTTLINTGNTVTTD